MRIERQSSSIRRFFASRLFLFILLGIAIVVALNFARAYYQDYKVRQEIEMLENEVRQLEQKKIESLEILQYVTSKSFVEEKARTELNMKLPGEKTIIIQQPEGEQKLETTIVTTALSTVKTPLKWWYFFTHQPLPY